jgi:hypothetical protein
MVEIMIEKIDSVLKKTPEKIHHDIAEMLSKGIGHIDALVLYSERENMEIETVAEIVKKSDILKEKIRAEAIKMRLLKVDKNAPRRLF